jgi:hypothetical protein
LSLVLLPLAPSALYCSSLYVFCFVCDQFAVYTQAGTASLNTLPLISPSSCICTTLF